MQFNVIKCQVVSDPQTNQTDLSCETAGSGAVEGNAGDFFYLGGTSFVVPRMIS